MIPRLYLDVKRPSLRAKLAPAAALFLALLTAFSSTAQASFEELPTGGRQAGMGDAFAAVADDAYAMYYNPAGLVQVRHSEFTADYSKLYSGLTDGSNISREFVGYAHPTLTHGTFGFSYLSMSLADLYSESTVGLTYALPVKDRWNLGGTIKFLKKSYGSDQYTQSAINSDTGASLGAPDPLFAQNGNGKSAASFDLGAQYRLTKIYGLGFSMLNVNSPNMALSSSDQDRVGAIYKFGLARRTKTSTVDVELTQSRFTSDEYRLNMGAERWLSSGIGMRAGLGFGQRQYEITTVGFSYRWQHLELDYALVYPLAGIQGTFGTNQLSMTFRFGRMD